MENSRIEIDVGVLAQPFTFFKIVAITEVLENPDCCVRFFFPYKERAFARSLQVLLAPYFSTWQEKIEIFESEVVVSIPIPDNLITEDFSLELSLGLKIDSLKQNFLKELLDSVHLVIKSKNINQLARLSGVESLNLSSANISLSIDPEDIPEEFLSLYTKEIEKHLKYFEVLDAIRPFLKETRIKIQGSIKNLSISGEISY
jgi:hypothetical protein